MGLRVYRVCKVYVVGRGSSLVIGFIVPCLGFNPEPPSSIGNNRLKTLSPQT